MESSPLVAAPAARRPSARRSWGAVALAVGALLALARRGGAAELRAASALASNSTGGAALFPRPPAGRPRSGEAGAVGASTTIEIPMSAFLAFPAVVDWLVKKAGVDDPVNASATRDGRVKLLSYLPARLTIEFDERAVAGSVGRVASGGYVAFNLYVNYVASWTIVMDMKGALRQVSPGLSVNSVGVGHFSALKNKDEDTLLLVSSLNESASGYAYLWNWKSGEYRRVGGRHVWGTHDAQWAAHGMREALWVVEAAHVLPVDHCGYDQNVSLITADTGEILHTLRVPWRRANAHALPPPAAAARFGPTPRSDRRRASVTALPTPFAVRRARAPRARAARATTRTRPT